MNPITVASSSIKGTPDSCARFPGVARIADGTLVMHYDDGESVDSVRHQMRIAISTDNGRSWNDGGIMYDAAALGLPHLFTENCKPTAVGGQELVSIGFGFERDEPGLGLAAYAEKHGHFPKGHNTFSRSTDGGKSWSLPSFISHDYAALEFSGPALWCAPEETLLAFGPPFVLKGSRQRGLCFASTDRGVTWQERSTFFHSEKIAPWEVRSLRMSTNGRIWLIMWAYDLEKGIHLNNHLICSDDLGYTWSEPLDSGVRGQAANLFEMDGVPWILYTKREGDDPGIYCVPADNPANPVTLWTSAIPGTDGSSIIQQFHNLKFGQPSMTPLGNGEWLLAFWSCSEADGYAVRTKIIRFHP